MPHLQPRHKIIGARLARRRRLAQKYPVATTLIKRIEQQLDSHKYGDRVSEIDIKYRFLDVQTAGTFLGLHLDGRGEQEVDVDYLSECLARTLNLKDSSESELSTSQLLQKRAAQIVLQIDESRKSTKPNLDVIIGTTGAGKTSYSKALFTAGLTEFHKSGVIPSRVEYSKFFEEIENFKEDQIVVAIRQCMLRDFIFYARFYSRDLGFFDEIKRKVFKEKKLLEGLDDYLERTEGKEPGSLEYSVYDAMKDWADCIGYLQNADLLSECLDIANQRDVTFAVSFDGFDILKTEDFLIKDHSCVPIDALVSVLRSITARAAIGELKNLSSIKHISLYIRDTTYTRLKIELNRKAGGTHDFVPYWVLPPTYKVVTDKVAQLVGMGMEPDEKIHIGAFVNRLEEKVHKTINPFVDRKNRTAPFETSFSFNARNMKRHVIRCIIWCMEDILLHDDEFARRLSSGVNLDIFWKHVVENDFFAKLKSYQIIEELFLDETHQLRPQFMVSLHSIEQKLLSDDVPGAVGVLRDYDEIAGFYDCVLNYLSRDILHEGQVECLPALLVGVRLLQSVASEDWVDYFWIVKSLRSLGYGMSDTRIKFFLYAMIRAELIRIQDEDTIIESIEDCQFSLSKSGLFALNKLVFSVSYIGEAMMIANLPKNGFARFVEGRKTVGDKAGWLNSVIINSCLYLEYLKKIEEFERSNLGADEDFEAFSLYEKSRAALQKEVSSILNDPSFEANQLFRTLPQSVASIREEEPAFQPLLEF